MVDLAVPHLHLGVLEPERNAAVRYVDASLVHRACPVTKTGRASSLTS